MNDLEARTSDLLDHRAPAFDQPPDFADLVNRYAAAATAEPSGPAGEQAQPRQVGVMFAAAAAIALIGIGAIALSRTGSDQPTVSAGPAPADTWFVWPATLPAGWEILETRMNANRPVDNVGVVAAVADNHRVIMVMAEGVEASTRRPPSGPPAQTIDGTDYHVLHEDETTVQLDWSRDGVRYLLEAIRIDTESAIELARGTDAEYGADSGMTELDVPFNDQYRTVVDQQPFSEQPTNLAFRVSCPEVDAGQGCAHNITISTPTWGSAELTTESWWHGRAGSVHKTLHGDILISEPDSRSADAMVVLDSGLVLIVTPDFGPFDDPKGSGAVGLGHSPLTVEDIETIAAGLEDIDPATYDQRAQALN